MLRFSVALRRAVPYASLFTYNHVLQRVFETPRNKVALVREVPGTVTQHYTYGQLQSDVIAAANMFVQRKESLSRRNGSGSRSWLQPRRPDHVRSLFAQGERTASCDQLHDTGRYNCAVLSGPGYTFVVSVLAGWAVNQLMVPMSVHQVYNNELAYVLQDSGCRSIVGDGVMIEEKLPSVYRALLVQRRSQLDSATAPQPVNTAEEVKRDDDGVTYWVDTVFDLTSLLEEKKMTDSHTQSDVQVQWLAAERVGSPAMHSAEDVMQRLNEAREHEATARQSEKAQQYKEEHQRRYGLPNDYSEDSSNVNYNHQCNTDREEQNTEFASGSRHDGMHANILCFDDDKLDELNVVFRRWYEQPQSRPSSHDDCVMIYTSGTTARPKGAVHSHASVANTVRVLCEAWQWSSDDSILALLPMHHIHGLFNILFCALASGARCVSTNFDNPARIARRLTEGDITLFMAVPTVYTRLIEALESAFSSIERTSFRKACEGHVRLMVSGSAALPTPTLHRFRALSGHTLLERYGMTEVGMILSQPLYTIEQRVPGTVGSPLPGVRAWVIDSPDERDDNSNAVTDGGDCDSTDRANESKRTASTEYAELGQLAVASDSLFDRYWNNPAGTRKELRERADGWRFFDTGDTVGVNYRASSTTDRATAAGRVGVFTILGRSSVDIIKSSGYKLSALEIESMLLRRKDIFQDIAVVGARDDQLGEAVVAIVVLQPDVVAGQHVQYDADTQTYESDTLCAELHRVASEILAPYKCPRRYICVPVIPHSATGKVNKTQLKQLIGLP